MELSSQSDRRRRVYQAEAPPTGSRAEETRARALQSSSHLTDPRQERLLRLYRPPAGSDQLRGVSRQTIRTDRHVGAAAGAARLLLLKSFWQRTRSGRGDPDQQAALKLTR
ncbi:hypothetical protein OJAV_G00049450 [Oryzias javanicus]|uniref:Uncharacterized protein n=1 Tax=Oryzias javanicus TaxID=123683 RepID=A0A3S2PE91_ORYJA|nr:hypothetical protein OJAV_G00049450 [Oryzias javanicus]